MNLHPSPIRVQPPFPHNHARYDAFGNLLHTTFSAIPPTETAVGPTPNNFLFASEQFDPDLHLYYNRARYLNVSTGRFWTMDDDEPDQFDPPSLHRYLYVEVDPVDNSDPTGLFTQSFGYAVEAKVEELYGLDHPLNRVLFGKWARVGEKSRSAPYALKPDILDLTTNRWLEIKPLSISGLVAAAAAYGLYSVQLSGFDPDPTWPNAPRVVFVQDRNVGLVNVGGIILYTDAVLDVKELVTITSLGVAARFLTSVPPQAVANAVSEVVNIGRLVQTAIAGTEAELADIGLTAGLTETEAF